MSDKVYIPPLIEGGYFLVARAIFDSSLWTMCPTDRIVATYLIGKSNHSEQKWFDRYKQHDIVIQRGEYITSYNKIATENHITYKQSRDSIKRLLKHGVIEIVGEKSRMGSSAFLYIRVIKYGIYQNPNNYEGQYKVDIKSIEGQDKVEQKATNKNDNTLKNDNKDNTEGVPPSSVVTPKVEKPKKEYPDPTKKPSQYNTQDLVGHFNVRYQKIVGFPYPISWAKDCQIMKNLLKLYKPENIYDTINIFFRKATEPEVGGKENWLKDKITIEMFCKKVPTLLIELRERLNQARKD